MKTYYLFAILFICLFASCKHDNRPDYQQALDDLAKRYPDLDCRGYMLNKSVSNYNKDTVELKLQMLIREDDDEPIIVLSNRTGQMYAVPFPSNKHRNYWCFYGDTTNKIKKPGQITFNGEMTNALKAMQIKEEWRAEDVFKEIFIGLLECRPILVSDTSRIKGNLAALDGPDSCNRINIENYEDMLKGIHTLSWELDYNTFSDIKNEENRMYQFRNENPDFNGQSHYRIKVYRVPCMPRLLRI